MKPSAVPIGTLPAHGKTCRYYKYKCRCQPCVKAARDYQRRWKARNPTYHAEYWKGYRSL